VTGALDRDHDHWARHAADWISWARTPRHDAFWAYRSAFAEFVGPGPGRAIDVGCGEGRLSRLLTEIGWTVTACEPVAALLDAARDAGSAQVYIEAPADALPVADAAFGLVLAYNMLMDVADPAAAVAEMARVLSPGGRLIVGIVHPLADRMLIASRSNAPEDYFARKPFEGSETRDGLTMTFRGWAMPLSAYADLLTASGLAITRLSEPRPDKAVGWHGTADWSLAPLFLWIEARRFAPA
jgi:SAM-dependent methyltransferase